LPPKSRACSSQRYPQPGPPFVKIRAILHQTGGAAPSTTSSGRVLPPPSLPIPTASLAKCFSLWPRGEPVSYGDRKEGTGAVVGTLQRAGVQRWALIRLQWRDPYVRVLPRDTRVRPLLHPSCGSSTRKPVACFMLVCAWVVCSAIPHVLATCSRCCYISAHSSVKWVLSEVLLEAAVTVKTLLHITHVP